MTRRPRARSTGKARRGPTLTILATQLQTGDAFVDEEGEWAVTGHPYTMSGGKVVHAIVQRPGDPASAKERTWGAHERFSVRRAAGEP